MICQRATPHDIRDQRPLPGVKPLDPGTWLHIDEAYGAQMAERRRLLHMRESEVLAEPAHALAAGQELLDVVLDTLAGRGDVALADGRVACPDGVTVEIDRARPLRTLGQIAQEDFCLLSKGAQEHVLDAAVLCFPASWRLSEKIGHPLSAVHDPVEEYDAGLARRVQRLFDGVQPGRPLWRFNVLYYDDPALFQPRSAQTPRPLNHARRAPFIRSERQCILRLPRTRAVVFSIHTYVIASGTGQGGQPPGR